MENGQKKIFDLFYGRRVFCIPEYQRSYSWGNRQRKDFLEDIKNQRKEKDYFFGTVLFQEDKETEDGYEKISIVDGQQRLTTVVIFMKVLIDYLKDMGEKELDTLERSYIKDGHKVKIRLQSEDNEFFQTYIVGDGKNAKDFVKTPAQRRLLEAKEYFKKELIIFINDKTNLLSMRDKLENAKLLTYSVTNSAEATLIFETTNDRGKPLTDLEKIKSFLMYKVYVASNDESPDLLENIYSRFGEIYRILEKNEMSKKIDEDSILQYHFIYNENWNIKRDYQKYLINIKDRINNLLLEKENEKTLSYIDSYSISLKEAFDVSEKIFSSNEESVMDLILLKRVAIIYPLLIKAYLLDKDELKSDFLKIARLLEIFIFRVIGFKTKRTQDVDSYLNGLARDFNGEFSDLIKKLKEYILEVLPDNRFREKLSVSNFYEDYQKNDIKYLFWKYENYLRSSGKAKYPKMSEKEFSEEGKKTGFSIEHIASQNPKVTIETANFEELTEEFKEKFLHALGNLTIDPQSANSSKGRKPIEEKNSYYFKKAPLMTQNELDVFIKNKKWASESIKERQEKVILFALDYWNPLNIQ